MRLSPDPMIRRITILRDLRARVGCVRGSDVIFILVAVLAFRILAGFSLFSTPHHHGLLVHGHGAGGLVHSHGETTAPHHHGERNSEPAPNPEDVPEPTPDPSHDGYFSAATMDLHLGANTDAVDRFELHRARNWCYVDRDGRAHRSPQHARAPPGNFQTQTS